MSEHMPNNCSNCKHVLHETCRRYPPQVFWDQVEERWDNRWPHVPLANSCGEWSPKITPLQGFKAMGWLKSIIARAEQEGSKDAWAPLRDAREWVEGLDR